MAKAFFLCVLLLVGRFALAQDNKTPFGKEGQFTFETEKPYKLLELDEKTSEPIVSKKKKPKRNTYYGIKTRKGYTRKGFGDKITIELFYTLKKPDKPQMTKATSPITTTPVPPRFPPGSTVRSLSWLRRRRSSRSGGVLPPPPPVGCGPVPHGPLPPPDPHGPPP